ncbi:hypothetical protein GALMADRAFT_216731 [Galerina marginata CBS 339.88]|uniref:Uncharacterized protein n=1 Tax=Galerina marginata (strain CBS 339.88) TaxID=685588 RepID=A0A067S8D5_GALM3|nr:hypothetical protein GALMADRAFT_216731 [Galerina marginata CBS 339.88]
MERLMAMLYPYRRIRITEMVKAGVVEVPEVKRQEDRRWSRRPHHLRRNKSPRLRAAGRRLKGQPAGGAPTPPPQEKQVADASTSGKLVINSYLLTYLTITTEPRKHPLDKHDASIVNIFKDIAQLSPLFRDGIINLSINQGIASISDERPVAENKEKDTLVPLACLRHAEGQSVRAGGEAGEVGRLRVWKT